MLCARTRRAGRQGRPGGAASKPRPRSQAAGSLADAAPRIHNGHAHASHARRTPLSLASPTPSDWHPTDTTHSQQQPRLRMYGRRTKHTRTRTPAHPLPSQPLRPHPLRLYHHRSYPARPSTRHRRSNPFPATRAPPPPLLLPFHTTTCTAHILFVRDSFIRSPFARA